MNESATKAWRTQLRNILDFGRPITGGQLPTLELLGCQLQFDMNYPVIHHYHRKLNYRFMCAEAQFICDGDNRVEHIGKYCKNIKKYSDNGLTFNGAYGPIFNSQVMFIINTLLLNEESRQAVLTIWSPNPITSVDYKCTISMHFMIRENKIHTFVNMRSSDIFLGIPYDSFNFTMMTCRILTLLNDIGHTNYKLGTMYLNLDSSHLYNRNEIEARIILKHESEYITPKEIHTNFDPLNWYTLTNILERYKNNGDVSEPLMFM